MISLISWGVLAGNRLRSNLKDALRTRACPNSKPLQQAAMAFLRPMSPHGDAGRCALHQTICTPRAQFAPSYIDTPKGCANVPSGAQTALGARETPTDF